MLIVTYLVTYW